MRVCDKYAIQIKIFKEEIKYITACQLKKY